jgi:CarboxypepD_reg-like domain
MKYLILFLFFIIGFFANTSIAQRFVPKDSVIQLYGAVLTADNLKGVNGASVIVVGKGRGTIANYDGVFSIVVLKGDKITFSSIGYKDYTITIPDTLTTNDYTAFVTLTNDVEYLPAVVLKPRPTREEFERDFLNNRVADDLYETARKNTDEAARRVLLQTLPADGREAVNLQLRQQANKYYYAGQIPPMNILNPAAWVDFVKAWKRGDFKRKN